MIDINEDTPDLRYFRVTFDLGRAVEDHRRALASAWSSHGFGSRQLIDFMVARSREWLDQHVAQLASLDYASHIVLVRSKIESSRTLVHPALQSVYGDVASSLSQHSPGDLMRYLQDACDAAHDHAKECIHRFGGAAAIHRWESCEKAKFGLGSRRDLTVCSFECGAAGGSDIVEMHLGNPRDAANHPLKGALRVFYCVPFFLLHEYVSHSFCVWQADLFVDGYLVWAARQMSLRVLPDHLRDRFVRDTLVGIEQREGESTKLEQTEGVAEWFSGVTTPEMFLYFLLEWAATVPEGDLHDATLWALAYLPDLVSGEDDLKSLRGCLQESGFARAGAGICNLARTLGQFPPAYTSQL